MQRAKGSDGSDQRVDHVDLHTRHKTSAVSPSMSRHSCVPSYALSKRLRAVRARCRCNGVHVGTSRV
eukprot:CAMPEP_0179296918 /NCGR_PEP_ID=MMETSP0797-20121207/45191_1 /TAXON_ID=47934 /ORGANISM="Dinophysis acuminata, Strain DAEP01" /LENGTH=66 /DNA_ID=CAMNT_0021006221 /DNA_START=313 /DNA_END=513 /DNA_ORIENTATION=+